MENFKPNFIRFNTWSYTCAALFISSVFFVMGLLAFDIPLAILGGNNPETIQRMKEVWWAFPFIFLTALVLSLNFRVIRSYIKGELKKRNEKLKLFLAANCILACTMIALIVIWYHDDEIGLPNGFQVTFYAFSWLVFLGVLYFGAIAAKKALKSNRRG